MDLLASYKQKIDDGKLPSINFESNVTALTELTSQAVAQESQGAADLWEYIFAISKYFYIKTAEMKVIEPGAASRLM